MGIFKTKAQKLVKKLDAHPDLKVKQVKEKEWEIYASGALTDFNYLAKTQGGHKCIGKIKEIKGQKEAELYVFSDRLEHIITFLPLRNLYIRK